MVLIDIREMADIVENNVNVAVQLYFRENNDKMNQARWCKRQYRVTLIYVRNIKRISIGVSVLCVKYHKNSGKELQKYLLVLIEKERI